MLQTGTSPVLPDAPSPALTLRPALFWDSFSHRLSNLPAVPKFLGPFSSLHTLFVAPLLDLRLIPGLSQSLLMVLSWPSAFPLEVSSNNKLLGTALTPLLMSS